MDDGASIARLAAEAGFRPDGMRLLLSLIHGYSLQRSLSGGTPHLDASEVVTAFFGLAQERYGVLARDVLGHWGVRTPSDVGRAVDLLVRAGHLHRAEEEQEDDYDGLPSPPDDWPHLPDPPPLRESVNWGGV